MPAVGIKTFLPNGDPNDVKIIEISNWSGKAFIIPRGKLKEIREQEEAGSPAVYFLFGDGEDSSRPRVYIGESESFYNRLANHNDNKDFWNTVVVFTGGLNRAHVKYLENKAVQLAKNVNRYDIVNQVEPLENRLSDFEKAEVADFFEKLKLILGVSGFTLFQQLPRQEEFEKYYFKTDKADAMGALLDTGEFIVFKDSLARVRETDSSSGTSSSILRFRLKDEAVLVPHNEESLVFSKDYIFRSPSAAGDVVAGRSVNGWTVWKDAAGKTLDENKRK